MRKEEFVQNIANQFDETDASEISLQTVFKDLDEWSSLLSLSIIAMCDEEYGVKVTGNDIMSVQTVEDLYQLVNSKR
jgi:acyl carrier protein